MAGITVPSSLREASADFAPKIVDLADDLLFGDVLERPQLSTRDRSLVTVSSLIIGGNWEQLEPHIRIATQNGLTETELNEAMIHLHSVMQISFTIAATVLFFTAIASRFLAPTRRNL